MNGEHIELTLNAPGERLDIALTAAMPALSRMQWQRLIKDGLVTQDGKPLKGSLRLSGGETVTVILPPVVETAIVPEPLPLDIRYEDNDVIVINKEAGMVVHPSMGHERGTLVNGILAYCPHIAGVGGERRPGIVHRLDKDTSGLIVVAKNDHALRYVQAQFKARTVRKLYLALVEGLIQPSEALIDAPIGRDPRHRKRMSVLTTGSAKARSAQTEYKVLTTYKQHALVQCHLFTGRTHQIRVHLAYVGYPLVGDKVYGYRRQRLQLRRHFLHATELAFKRPSDEQEITIQSELPPELQAVLAQLEADMLA